ncbi:MAG TPA: class I SAM-dependent methyltransferase [Thermoanaerobaculia bacterium]|nr:class I SAM-dependent methyltransferase [Thermoanaerobaculia bacterium]
MLRRLYRRFFPRRSHPLLDQPITFAGHDTAFSAAYEQVIAHDADSDSPFIRERYREGIRWRNVLDALLPPSAPPRNVLDVGSGNGAVTLAVTATGRYTSCGVDTLLSDTARCLQRGTPAHATTASGEALPFADATFDAVLCLETIEHVPPEALHRFADELTRVLHPSGIILLTTPPRLRFVLRADPHFGIRGLLLFPSSLQRRIATSRGYGQPHHYVGRIFSSAGQIARLFPGFTAEVLSRSRAPRRWIWDAIVLKRKAPLRAAALSTSSTT